MYSRFWIDFLKIVYSREPFRSCSLDSHCWAALLDDIISYIFPKFVFSSIKTSSAISLDTMEAPFCAALMRHALHISKTSRGTPFLASAIERIASESKIYEALSLLVSLSIDCNLL